MYSNCDIEVGSKPQTEIFSHLLYLRCALTSLSFIKNTSQIGSWAYPSTRVSSNVKDVSSVLTSKEPLQLMSLPSNFCHLGKCHCPAYTQSFLGAFVLLTPSFRATCRSLSIEIYSFRQNVSFFTAFQGTITKLLDFKARFLLCGLIATVIGLGFRRSSIMEPKYGSSVILVVSLLVALLHPTAACVADERTALLAFKAGIKEDSQGMLSRWVANGDCCGWGGTFCDNSEHVTQIDLAPDPAFDDDTVFLKGTISPALAKLKHLKRLDLASLKQLSGSLPAALGNLKSLQYLGVRTNQLTGSIPASYGGLTSLTWIDLGANKLGGGIPSALGNIGPQLQYLFLGYNKLSGAIPTSLYNLKGLQDFYLTGNQLTGEISPLVGQLKALTNLDFSNNKLTGTLPSVIGSLTQLGFFDMSGNKLTGTIPSSFGNLKNIYHFTINNNKISGQIPAVLAQNWKKLLFIDFSNNELTGPIPQGAPFSTFPASSFAGNPGLRGNPLPACN